MNLLELLPNIIDPAIVGPSLLVAALISAAVLVTVLGLLCRIARWIIAVALVLIVGGGGVGLWTLQDVSSAAGDLIDVPGNLTLPAGITIPNLTAANITIMACYPVNSSDPAKGYLCAPIRGPGAVK